MDQLLEFIGNHPWLVLAFVGVLVALIATEVLRRFRKYQEISPAQATRLINRENAAVLDVRSAKEYEQGHIASARHAALDGLEREEKNLQRLRGRPVVVYCAMGQRSGKAAAWLVAHGFERVFVLAGGMRAWQSEQFPVQRGKD